MSRNARPFTKAVGGHWRRDEAGAIRRMLMRFDPTSVALGALGGIAVGGLALPALAAMPWDMPPLASLAAASGLSLAAVLAAMRSNPAEGHGRNPYPSVKMPTGFRGPAKDCRAWLADKVRILPQEVQECDPRVLAALATQLTPARIPVAPFQRFLHVAFAMYEAGVRFRDGSSTRWLDAHDVLREMPGPKWGTPTGEEFEAYLTALSKRVTEKDWAVIQGLVEERMRLHGTRETALMGALAAARRARGVLACSEFRWLAGQDVELWYAMQNLGRGEAFVQGLAALNHFAAEDAAGVAIDTPRVGRAAACIAGRIATGARGTDAA